MSLYKNDSGDLQGGTRVLGMFSLVITFVLKNRKLHNPYMTFEKII